MNAEQLQAFHRTLEKDAGSYGVTLDAATIERLAAYYVQLNSWNSLLHLVAPASPAEFATRHILESLVLLKYLPLNSRLADVGSGGGLPILPCLIARPDLQAILIESSKKKAVFLREAITAANLDATVIAERFEETASPAVDFVTCRALERFEGKVQELIRWAPLNSTLLLFGGPGLRKSLEKTGSSFESELLPRSEQRFLYRVRGLASSDHKP